MSAVTTRRVVGGIAESCVLGTLYACLFILNVWMVKHFGSYWGRTTICLFCLLMAFWHAFQAWALAHMFFRIDDAARQAVDRWFAKENS